MFDPQEDRPSDGADGAVEESGEIRPAEGGPLDAGPAPSVEQAPATDGYVAAEDPHAAYEEAYYGPPSEEYHAEPAAVSRAVADPRSVIDGRASRILPHSDEAEQALLGAILIDADVMSELAIKLKSADFYRPVHRTIYAAMLELFDQRQPIDYVTIYDLVPRMRAQQEAAGRADLPDIVDVPLEFLMELTERAPISANALHYAGQIRQKAILRELIETSEGIYDDSFNFAGDLPEFLDGIEQKLYAITQRDISQDIVTMRSVLREIFEKLDEFQDRNGRLTGCPSGFYDLDELTGGFQPGEMIVLAARPSMGKTTMALSILRYVGLREKIPCAFFSCEMGRAQIVQNMLCAEAKINSKRLRSGYLDEYEYDRLVQAAGKLAEAPVFIDDTASIGLRELRAKARRMKEKGKIDIIFIDYLQLMGKPPGLNRSSSREQEIAIISRGIKALARELKIPIVVLAQLNRDVEKRGSGGHKPRMSDLRESGSIEQDADVIALLHREFYYTRNEEDKNLAELILAKQRNGPTGDVPLTFQPEIMRFENRDDDAGGLPGGGGFPGATGAGGGGRGPQDMPGGPGLPGLPGVPAPSPERPTADAPPQTFEEYDAFDEYGDAPPPVF